MVKYDDTEYLTPDEAAKMLRVTKRTLARYASEGRLTRYKQGWQVLYMRSEVEAFIEQQKQIRPYEDE